jgi:ribosomal protein L1
MKKKSKRYREILKSLIKDNKITTKEVLDLVKKNSTTKFDESIDVSLRIYLKQTKGGDLSFRSVGNLQNG